MPKKIKLGIVIPSKPKPSLVKLLEGLRDQEYHEIIVEMRGNNPAQARNLGFKRLSEDTTHILFIDDDVVVAPNFIAEGLKQFTENHYDFAQSRVVGEQENSYEKFIGTAMWFTRDCFKILDGFDEQYAFFNEDIDCYLRAKNFDLNYGYLNKSIAFHLGMGAFEKLVASNLRLEAKYPKEYKSFKQELR